MESQAAGKTHKFAQVDFKLKRAHNPYCPYAAATAGKFDSPFYYDFNVIASPVELISGSAQKIVSHSTPGAQMV